ncbi:MAG TPA: XdhC family protein [Acidobacteriaceae bacterium]|nr:XdhC family protein [Acidobacteriaceae bacterium]
MAELRKILELWKRASAADEEVCVATVAAIEGSSYRRPGARMLLTAGGQRAGTISGGCLEAEVAKKAWWLTERGASVERYISFFDDDGDMVYGLGCGGAIQVLLERAEPAKQALEALRRSVEDRAAQVVVAGLGQKPGTALIVDEAGREVWSRDASETARALAQKAVRVQASQWEEAWFAEYIAPPPALFVFGAGDDAQPLARLAWELDWHVTVADGRSHLARAERFPQADAVQPLAEALGETANRPGARDAAVIMTHSYEQDREILRALLGRDLRYLGILGPRRRTEHLVHAIAPELGMDAEECLTRLHAPVGLDLGGHAPAAIALSIAAELQAVFAGVAAASPHATVPA